ncbi:urea transporter 1-like [Arapaima gigas]
MRIKEDVQFQLASQHSPPRAQWRVRSSAGGTAHTMYRHIQSWILYCTGDMSEFRKFMDDQPFLLQLAEWSLRGMAQVIMANNPISGGLILVALVMESPWQALVGTLGLLVSTLSAIVIGMDSVEVSMGLHGLNGMLVSLLIGIFSSAGDWYWWLLLPVCIAAATCTFVSGGLQPVLDLWDLPVSVFPFNTVIVLYLSCTGSANPYFPHHVPVPPGGTQGNSTQLNASQVLQGVLLGVGQIYACGELWPSVLILVAVIIFSPLLCTHAILGSGAGMLAGLSVASQHSFLYSGLCGFNGALGCMAIGGLYFSLSWKTHFLSIASALLSSYGDLALRNLLGTVGLPACSWAATLTVSLTLLLTARRNLSTYRIPTSQITTPERNLCTQKHWAGTGMESTV